MKIISLDKKNREEVLKEVLKVLKTGGIAVIPTDTVYGFVADAANSEGVEKIYKIKKRPPEKLFPIFVDSIPMAKTLVSISDRQGAFLLEVWPGKVTCVLESVISGTLGLRMPDDDFILELLQKFGHPLSQTSANISGRMPHAKISELIQEFENFELRPDLIVDGGDIGDHPPSTVVDLTKEDPIILREGAVSGSIIKKLWEELQ
ncbi:threonylcarbamoyl-AMP synthase [Candidatus Giovannonibacteria bacterium]|nr:threonylcarbamoyl-AMP synthase [Candidatus Giovannonibacteria bacterium]